MFLWFLTIHWREGPQGAQPAMHGYMAHVCAADLWACTWGVPFSGPLAVDWERIPKNYRIITQKRAHKQRWGPHLQVRHQEGRGTCQGRHPGRSVSVNTGVLERCRAALASQE